MPILTVSMKVMKTSRMAELNLSSCVTTIPNVRLASMAELMDGNNVVPSRVIPRATASPR